MIISASRRTDIPAYYSEWLFKRLQEGFCITVNPINPTLFYKIPLNKEIVDAIVFWSKNPYPMLKKLHLLSDYQYYFQYTITPYADDIEKNLPRKKYLVDTFIKLSKLIGKNRVIWRYDPILLSPKYSIQYHLQYFNTLCGNLAPYTTKVIVSFLTIYRKNKSRCEDLQLVPPTPQEKDRLLAALAETAYPHGLRFEICSQDFPQNSRYPIYNARCIDLNLINELTGKNFIIEKDPSQRDLCGCVKSCDIGMYNSCYNGCVYCYAAYKNNRLEENKTKHNPESPMLIGELPENVQIIDRSFESRNSNQLFLM